MTDRVLVLAAGRGTRMGGPKALMSVAGEPWWRHQQRRLDAIGLSSSWLVSPAVRAAMAGHADAPSRLIDADEAEPMFATLVRGARALSGLETRGVFVLPIDVPVPRASVWRALCAAECVAVPVYQGQRGHPIYLPWGWIEAELLPRADDSSARLDELVRGERVEVPADDVACTMNLNTPDDLKDWLDASIPENEDRW